MKEAQTQLVADRLALQQEQQRVKVAEEKAAAALSAAREQAARAESERAWVRKQQEELTPRLESSSAAQAEAKQRARELATQAEELGRERQHLEGERTALNHLREKLEASQAQADRALAQASEVAAREAALAAKERGLVEQEAALKLREAQVAQVCGERGGRSKQAMEGWASGWLRPAEMQASCVRFCLLSPHWPALSLTTRQLAVAPCAAGGGSSRLDPAALERARQGAEQQGHFRQRCVAPPAGVAGQPAGRAAAVGVAVPSMHLAL